VLGNLLRFRTHGLLAPYLKDWRTYGDIVRYKLGPREVVACAHPDELRHIFVKNRACYGKGVSVENIVPLIGDGLFAADGDHWQRQRRLLHRMFTANAVRAHERAMQAAIEATLTRWNQRPSGETLDVLPEMSHLAMDVICRTMFGVAADDAVDDLGRAVTEAFSWVGDEGLKLVHIPLSVPTRRNRRFLRAKAQIDQFLSRVIDARRSRSSSSTDEEHTDLLDHLLAASDEESGAQMSDAQVINEVITIFIAGHETTAVTLTWAWLLLAGSREVEAKLDDELERVLSGRTPTVADLPALTYTRQVLDETLRHYPPVWVDPREAVADDVLGSYPIKAGTILMPMLYATHRHPEFWDDPERFDPDRFAPELAKGRHPMAHAPFGGGPRVCLGMAFAYQEMVLALAMIAQRFRIQRAYGTLTDYDPFAGTLRPLWPALVDVHRRD